MVACLDVLTGWGVAQRHASVALPALAAYDLASCWPHIRTLYLRHGFRATGHTEIVLAVEIAALPAETAPPVAGLELERSVGRCGTRFEALRDGREVGYIEVDVRGDRDARVTPLVWADIGNLWVDAELRCRGIATWLLGHAAAWLRLGGVDRLVTYEQPDAGDGLAFALRHGFRELHRVERGWTLE